ncbi:MAG: DUF1549 and DUF1553 domain-containing protein [Planctomycetota bacterium]|nr:DUF1549 and DUF1553 domain-containing protein [Planctomycetota bacterium]MDA1247628.1 DUF1549 and DUF1553 domain-containing protein [Planctomycetota bacterium]
MLRNLIFAAFFLGLTSSSKGETLSVAPATVTLTGRDAEQQIIVGSKKEGRDLDLTRDAKFTSMNPQIAAVNSAGIVTPVADGTASIRVEHGSLSADVSIEVKGSAQFVPVDFQNDVMPVLTAGSCNAGACHGKARGQNGFQLSLLGFDANFDFNALAKEGRGRRVFLPSPEQSLLLLKPIGAVPHGGGMRLEPGGAGYRILRRWIEAGLPRAVEGAPTLQKVEITPGERIIDLNSKQQLIVTASYSDGSTRDVTRMAGYQSNESAIAAVDKNGLVTTSTITGEAAIMTRYMDEIAVTTISVPLPGSVDPEFYKTLPQNNYIDGLVWKKLERLGLTPSEPAPEHKFLRRTFIDIIGRTPTGEESRSYLADTSDDRRAKLIDRLLDSPEFADHWANKWADLLRPNPYHAGIKAVLNYDNWIRTSFRQNKPYDQFVRELLTAKGGTFRNGAVTMFRDRRSPDELTMMVSQLFLGIRLECAKCHHHPNEVWGQDDFYGLAAYFSKVARKGTGISAPISGSEEFIYAGRHVAVTHPLTGEEVKPKPLFGEAAVAEDEKDPREVLATWITSDENPFFRQVIANRIWMDMMSRGLVEPVDDLRLSNPASNRELLETLALDLRDHKYDMKHLIRRIASSYVYGLSSMPSDRNVADTRNYSRYYRERLRAEVMLDSVSQITGVPENFAAMPPDSQARQLWSHRIDSLFLDAFGRPDPNQNPPCERTPDTTIVQALHLMNSQSLYTKVTSDAGLAAKLVADKKSPEEIVEELYLETYSRFPTEQEKSAAVSYLNKSPDKLRQASQDLLWAMLNTPEFIFKH